MCKKCKDVNEIIKAMIQCQTDKRFMHEQENEQKYLKNLKQKQEDEDKRKEERKN